jgi:hypothetical protein
MAALFYRAPKDGSGPFLKRMFTVKKSRQSATKTWYGDKGEML